MYDVLVSVIVSQMNPKRYAGIYDDSPEALAHSARFQQTI